MKSDIEIARSIELIKIKELARKYSTAATTRQRKEEWRPSLSLMMTMK